MALSAKKQLPIARAISEVGNSLRYIALPLGIVAIRSRAQDLALAEILETIGFISSGILAPFFIDRAPKLIALALADLLSLSVTALMAYGVATRDLHLLWVACFAMTFVDTIYSSSLSAVTADIEQDDPTANRAEDFIYGFSRLQFFVLLGGLVGSILGIGIVQKLPLWNLLVLDGCTFLLSSLWIMSLATRLSPPKVPALVPSQCKSLVQALSRVGTDWIEGFSLTLKNAETRRHVLTQGVVGIAHGLLSATVVGHYKTTLKVSDAKVGLAQANNRIWQLGGASYMLRSKVPPALLLVIASLLMGIGYLGMGYLPFYGFLIAYGLQQLGNAILAPTNRALTFDGSTPEARGRIAAFRGLIIDAGVLIGNCLALLTITALGTSSSFIWAACLLFGVSAIHSRLTPSRAALPTRRVREQPLALR